MLDASKTFDHVNYCKLFNILLDNKVCSLYCGLLLDLYLKQKFRVRWDSTYSQYFNVSNGVKQGSVISQILFCIYMDRLLNELANSGVGCYMRGVFSGATGYSDDLKLLTPNVKVLKILATICEQCANKVDVLFNGKKSLLIIYKCTRSQPPDQGIVINNVTVPRVDEIIILGHYMCDDIYKFNAY